VSRAHLFATKLGIGAGFAAGSVALLLLLGLGVGLVAVGWGDLDLYPGVLQMTDRHQHLEQDVALARFALVWPAATLALLCPLALSLLVSAWVRSPVNAVGVAVSLYLVLYVVAEIHFFQDLRPWLFTSYLAYWRELFREEVDWRAFAEDGCRLLGFAFLFLALAFRRFRTREEL
jgi:ABC-2 type transport system permease protein